MDAFTEALLKNIEKAEKELQIRQPKLQKYAVKNGGVSTAKEYFRHSRVSDGFDALAASGHLELSLEALAIQGKWNAEFTDDEVNFCFSVLCAEDYFTGKKNRK